MGEHELTWFMQPAKIRRGGAGDNILFQNESIVATNSRSGRTAITPHKGKDDHETVQKGGLYDTLSHLVYGAIELLPCWKSVQHSRKEG